MWEHVLKNFKLRFKSSKVVSLTSFSNKSFKERNIYSTKIQSKTSEGYPFIS